jgi:ppGpp synthetase/RelA/SpoT-type nucleotidyltranferase
MDCLELLNKGFFMDFDDGFGEFLLKNSIQKSEWDAAGLEWESLREIGVDHVKNLESLNQLAEIYSKAIQGFEPVHSVRWRVKDVNSLMNKIFLKRLEGKEKYKDISKENYREKITDLIGIRAIHLYKNDCLTIDKCIRDKWEQCEKTIAYIRDGDGEVLKKQFEESGFDVQEHRAGYRSIHYVSKSKPFNGELCFEIQVRTIFEEGWSEIDHKMRYSSASDDQLVANCLTIFNRLAGYADEMGSFVRDLSVSQVKLYKDLEDLNRERDQAHARAQDLLVELEKSKDQGTLNKNLIDQLRRELQTLKLPVLRIGGLGEPFGSLGASSVNFTSPISFNSGLGVESYLSENSKDLLRVGVNSEPLFNKYLSISSKK